MKVLIVDDESHVRDAIRLLLPWDALGFERILDAESGQEAMQLIWQERPELAIVDVVIGDTFGMEVMNYINDKRFNTKVIVISGHDDFQYVRAMFILGALEYLLKPIEQDKLEIAVRRAMDRMREEPGSGTEEFAVDQRFKTLSPDRQHGLLRKLFRPELSARAYEELIQTAPHFQGFSRCVILHCAGCTLPVHKEDAMLKLSRLVNKMQEKLETDGKGTIFQNMKPSIDVVILIYGTDKTDFAEEILDLKKQTVGQGCVLRLGCSNICSFPGELEKAWEEAKTAADYVPGGGMFSAAEYQNGMHPLRLRQNSQAENALRSSVILGNIAAVEDALSQWAEKVMDGMPRTVGVYRRLWEEFFQLYKKWEAEDEASEDSVFLIGEEKSLGDILEGPWNGVEERMYQYFLEAAAKLIEKKRQSQNAAGMMPKVVDFLELNYRKKFSQQECADYFHVNKDYLSRAFKKYTGIGMARYLNNLRIEKAKELLRSTDLQVMEIADQVGYFDAKYFSRQFKLAVGLTPAQYRSGALPEEVEAGREDGK